MKKIISRSLYFIILYSAMAFAGDVEITSNTDPAGGYHVKTDYLFFTLNELGTLGNNASSPGIQHDPLGGRTFSAGKDYISPGVPFEGFSVDYNGSTLHNNNSLFPRDESISPITGSYSNRSTSSLLDLTWQGTKAGFFDISHKFSLSSTGQNLNITTTITALSDLTGVKFLRVVDPDQDASTDLPTTSTHETNNTRGLGSYPETDIVCASGAVRGDLKVCLYSNSSETHNTGVSADYSTGWSKTPSDYLSGTNLGNGDKAIGIAANLGSLSTGSSKIFTYSYLFSSSPDSLLESIALASVPSAADTQRSLSVLAQRYRTPYNYSLMSSNYANMNTYDCNLFDKNNMCISAGGRITTIDNPSSHHSAAVVVLGYKVSPSIRIGGFLDQSVNHNMPSGVDMSNKNPMAGAFAVWNHQANGLGFQMKLANAYLDKDVTTSRAVIGTSEAGRGRTDLNTQSYVGELSYAFQYQEKTLVRPYFALRYSRIKQDGYTEDTTASVTSPLTYAKLSDRSTSALMGVKVNHALTPKTNLTASLGVEQDLDHKSDQLVATGVSGLTSENFNNNIRHTRPVASLGAYYAVAKNQRLSGDIYYQQLPFQSTDSATAYVNYMIGF
jgi:hypothetical protein